MICGAFAERLSEGSSRTPAPPPSRTGRTKSSSGFDVRPHPRLGNRQDEKKDYYRAGRHWEVRPREKKQRDVLLHCEAKGYLDSYLEAIPDVASRNPMLKTAIPPLRRKIFCATTLFRRPMSRTSVLHMVKSQTEEAGWWS